MSECAAALISVSVTLTNLSAKKDSLISRKFMDKRKLIECFMATNSGERQQKNMLINSRQNPF